MTATLDAPIPPAQLPVDEAEPRSWAELESWCVELDRIRAERLLPPTFDADRMADMEWFFERLNAGDLDGYLRRFVAIRNKTVVADGPDRTGLELTMARRHPDLHPDCFFVTIVD